MGGPQYYALSDVTGDLPVGARAHSLARAVSHDLPVPQAVAMTFQCVNGIASGDDLPKIEPDLGAFLSLRSSPGDKSWGGPPAILNIGITDETLPILVDKIGTVAAWRAYRRLIQTFAVRIHDLDPEEFESLYYSRKNADQPLTESGIKALVNASKDYYAAEMGEPFPQDPNVQLSSALRRMAKEWHAPTSQILRTAKGAPADAGLGIIVQEMVFGLGKKGGAGSFQQVDSSTGLLAQTGQYIPNAQGSDAHRGGRVARTITKLEREGAGQSLPSLAELVPGSVDTLTKASDVLREEFRDQMALYFTNEVGKLWLLDMVPARRTASAAIQVAVDLARMGVISRDEALLRVEPRNLIETLHPHVHPDAHRDVFGRGLPASPGAASGRVCFSSEAAQTAHAQGEPAILVRNETSPDDIRGMHVAAAVLTVSGGMTSHAALIARGLGVPCVVGVSDLIIDSAQGQMIAGDGRILRQGDYVTLDGTTGEALVGTVKMRNATASDSFETLMAWADSTRRLKVRANADTPQDAQVARRFNVDGIGLCRTEHTFFEGDRITTMREMILADTDDERQRALDMLLPMQRADFEELFELMPGLPVTIRLLDPPLHEFLPKAGAEMEALSKAMGVPLEQLTARTAALSEFNPMLGKRGVRVGITMPQIYDMQARAIFEAAHAAGERAGAEIIPEIMIPLVSANREVELVKERIVAVATEVERERSVRLNYKIGVMVETPRAALRAGDLAETSAFLSFGTNDLTQMTYGLSRDDAGRFMRDYVAKGVFAEDPFHTLDLEGVGELLLIAARRGRDHNRDLVLGICGEHGGDPASIRFCEIAGFDYVSCSPYRVPIARLAAAQAAILAKKE